MKGDFYMENQYTYYTPKQDENNQNAGGPDLKEPHKKNKERHSR